MQKMTVTSLLHAAILVASTMLIGCASAKQRQERTLQDLAAARQADDATRADQTRQFMQKVLARAEAKAEAAAKNATATRPTIDVLVISGGGDWGAFGAGVLKGWGRVTGEFARPQFDIVTGVSTGALTLFRK